MHLFFQIAIGLSNLYYASSQCLPGFSKVIGEFDSVVLADPDSLCVRTFTFSGVHTLLAGNEGLAGYIDGAGTVAKFKKPSNLVLSPDKSSVIMADSAYNNYILRKIDLVSGGVSTYAGSIYTPTASNLNNNGVGIIATFYYINGISVLNQNFYVSVALNILRVVSFPGALVGNVFVGPVSYGTTDGTVGSGGLVTSTAVYFPSPDGTFFISSDPITSNPQIRKYQVSTNAITTLGGGYTGCGDGIGVSATFRKPGKVLFSKTGTDIFIADSLNYGIRKMVIQTKSVTKLLGTCSITTPTAGDGTGISIYISDMVMSPDGLYIYAAQSIHRGIRKILISSGAVVTIGGGSLLPISTSGYFLALNGPISCVACVSGQYSTDGSLCTTCPSGAYCSTTSSAPTSCLPGVYNHLEFNGFCQF
jgi:hypothetical protein